MSDWPEVAAPGTADVEELRRQRLAEDAATTCRGTVVTLADVAAERVSWLWPGRLPLGKLVVVDGDPSVGKSTLMADVAARVSAGAAWPDGTPGGVPADVLMLSAEDGLADTVVPRLQAAGADRRRVHALTQVSLTGSDEDGPQFVPPSLPRDIPLIEQVVLHHGVRLVVVDVLMAFLNAGVDSHRDQDVRGVLHQLASMAERAGCCIVLLRHLNKAGGGSPLYRGGGSIGIIGAARAAFIVARDPEDQERRVFAVTKLNISTEPPALAYRLVDDPANGCARMQWEDAPTDHTAAALLRGPADEEERTERDDAAAWLTGYLADRGGEAPRADVLKASRTQGITLATLNRAKVKAGVSHEARGFSRGTVWMHPDSAPGASISSISPQPAPAQGETDARGEIDGPDLGERDPQPSAERHPSHPAKGETDGRPSLVVVGSEDTETCARCHWTLGSTAHAVRCEGQR